MLLNRSEARMAVEHLVCMKLRHPVPEEQLKSLYRECEARFDEIPGILTASMGENWHADASGFTHAIVIRLEDRGRLDLFMSHPAHVAAGRLLQSVFSEFLILDYETERP
jgi:hypothetical protein